MLSERAQRQADRFLDAAEEAMSCFDWSGVQQNAQAVLAIDPDNADARTFLAAAERVMVGAKGTFGASTLFRAYFIL